MAETLDYLIAQSFTLTASHKVTVTDAAGGPTAHELGGGPVYRIFAAQTSGGAGTLTNPYELLYKLREAIGSTLWNVTLRPNGVVRIAYDGAGIGTLVWTSITLRNLLGFASDLALTGGEYAEGSYLPTHCIFACAAHDTGWQDEPGRFSGARLPSGLVYGWGDSQSGLVRQIDFRLLPKDWATRAAIVAADASCAPGTPVVGLYSRRTNPSAAEPGQAPPWGAIETIATGGGRSLGAMLGTLQTAIASPVQATFDHCYFTPECIVGKKHIVLSVDGFDPRRDLSAVELSFYAEEQR